ncbi:hypothetical protein M9458_052322, partial [Cirrhinus mrigala]
MNGTRTYYIRHNDVVTCHASSQQRGNLKRPLHCTNTGTGNVWRFNVDWTDSSEKASVSCSQITPS